MTTWSGRSARFYVFVGIFAVVLIFLLLVVTTGVTTVEENEVGVRVYNYRSGAENMEPVEGGRTYIHLPLGLTTIYRLPRSEMTFQMVAQRGVGDQPGVDSVKIKSKGGADCTMDVNVIYKVDTARATVLVKGLGGITPDELAHESSNPMGTAVRAYARSIIRDVMGRLTIEEVLEAGMREAAISQAHQELQAAVEPWGLQIVTITATSPQTHPKYQEMVLERKKNNQQTDNESSRRGEAEQKRAAEQALATKDRAVRLAELRATLEPKKMNAQAEAVRIDQDAQRNFEQRSREADASFEAAQHNALGIRAEGENRAAGVKATTDAYEKGGIALVREALVKAYRESGAELRGRPYSLDSRVGRLKIEEEETAAAARKRE